MPSNHSNCRVRDHFRQIDKINQPPTMAKKQDTPLNEAGIGPLLDAARERWGAKFLQLTLATSLLGVIARCIETDDHQGLKNLLPKIRAAADESPA